MAKTYDPDKKINKENLKIGEISDLFGISKQTLQYYDKIDIFSPSFRKKNGYRIYYFEKCLELASILYFKNKGFSLNQIKDFKKNLNLKNYFNSMEEQFKSLNDQIIHLKKIKKAIKRKLTFVKKNTPINNTNKIWIEKKSKRFYYSIGNENELYIHNGFYQNPTVVFYEGKNRHFGCYLHGENQNPQSKFNKVKVKTISKGNYLCGYHVGSYKKILKRVDEIRKSHPDLKLTNWSVHFNIIDQFVETDKTNFLTEINIKIL